MHDLWMEYEENSSLEAKIVKDFDKVCNTFELFPVTSFIFTLDVNKHM